MPLAFMPKVRPRVLPTSFSSSEPIKVRRSLNITFLSQCLKSHEGLARELKTLPVVHLNENGLQLVFARTIRSDEHVLHDIKEDRNMNLLGILRIRKAIHFHMEGAEQ